MYPPQRVIYFRYWKTFKFPTNCVFKFTAHIHYNMRGLTKSSLIKNSNRTLINNIVNDQIELIDSEIYAAHTAGYDKVIHELPMNFQINNMEKSDAQILIYSELIQIYSKSESDGGKGFKNTFIKFDAAQQKNYLLIFWLNGMNKQERQSRNKIIADNIYRPPQ